MTQPEAVSENADAAQLLVARVLERLSPSAQLIITLLEIEDRSVKTLLTRCTSPMRGDTASTWPGAKVCSAPSGAQRPSAVRAIMVTIQFDQFLCLSLSCLERHQALAAPLV